jgi:PAS domain S-box-containing protein
MRVVVLPLLTGFAVPSLQAAGLDMVTANGGGVPAWAGAGLVVAVAALAGVFIAWRRAQARVGRQAEELTLARARLRESEERFVTLFENAIEGVYESTQDEGFCAVNPALARLFGFASVAEFLVWAQPNLDALYVRPGRRTEFLAALTKGDTLLDFESEVRCRDGSTKWISESVWVRRSADGQVRRLQGFVSDITARRAAESALRESAERYRTLFEHSPVAIFEFDYREVIRWFEGLRGRGVTDFDTYASEHPGELETAVSKVKLVGLNHETVRLFGAQSKLDLAVDPERMAGSGLAEVRRKIVTALWRGRTELAGEMTVLTFGGEERRVHYRWSLPMLGGRPDYAWTQLVMLDVSGVRQVEEALAAERERLIVTLRAMAEGVITTDADGTIKFINEAAERITGWTEGAAVGRMVTDVCPLRNERTQAAVSVPYVEALNRTQVVELPPHTVLVHRQGVVCVVDGRCAPIHDPQGRPVGTVLVLRDITQRARLEAELLRASKLESVGVLAGGIAHDFNNLLTVIMGNLTLAMLDAQVMTAAGKWLEEAERGALRARELTGQLLTFAKGGEPVRQAVSLPELVREAAAFALHGSSVRGEFVNTEGLWPANADQGQIGQVVQNLVLNAVQAMQDGGVVRISLQNEHLEGDAVRAMAPGRYLRLTISDSGTGIRPEHLGRIFDPYFTTKQTGNGLGLATVYSIIRKHEGHVEVESELGRGTTFRIWLPAAAEALPAPEPEAVVAAPKTGRILFMDDEEAIREMTCALLVRLGYSVTAVADGEAVIKAYVAAKQVCRPFDAVMLDLTVPGGMGGREAMQELLKFDPQVRGIVSSGYSSDPVMADYQEFGFRARVAKPYRVQDLAKALRSVMAEPVAR